MMQAVAPKRLTLTLWVRFLSQVNMLIFRTIFLYHPVIPVLFYANIQRFFQIDRVNSVALECTDSALIQCSEGVFNIVVFTFIA